MKIVLSMALAILGVAPAMAQTEIYQLSVGDRISFDLVNDALPATEHTIDLDGRLRIAGFEPITIVNKTLDDAEALLEGSARSSGLYLEPDVSLSVTAYAPVIIGGAVSQPGRFDYFANMTVGAAVSLTGGVRTRPIGTTDFERAALETAGQLNLLNLEMADVTVRAGRFSALLEGRDEIELSTEMRRAIPRSDAVDLNRLVQAEDQILSNELRKSEELQAHWQAEILTIERQLELLDARIAVQDEILTAAQENLATSLELQDRGLQTSARLIAAQQREADARARVLEIESLRVNNTRAIGEARRQLSTFIRNQQDTALNGLRDAQLELQTLRLRYARTLEINALLSDGRIDQSLGQDVFKTTYTIISAREERQGLTDVSLDTALLPGETLLVTVEASFGAIEGQ